jgi:hypothetical protein
MGELYERLLDQHPTKAKISTDQLQACMRHFRSGAMTVAQIDALFLDQYGSTLGQAATGDDAGRVEIQDLLATIPTGTTTTARLDRIERLAMIEAVLVIADTRTAPFNTPAALRTAFGVPNRS